MNLISLSEIAELSGAMYVGTQPTAKVTAIATDSRQVKPGNLFVALSGLNSDGHRYVKQALGRGALAALVSADWHSGKGHPAGEFIVAEGISDLYADSPLVALGKLGMNFRRQFDIPVVGITGSMGKTSIREMLGKVLRIRMNPLVSKANFNTEIGVPVTLTDLTADNDAAIVEMAMRGLKQIDYLCQLARPTAAIVTNVGISHLEVLGTRENIATGKAELLENLPGQGWSVLNADDDYFDFLASKAPGPVITFGGSEQAQYRVTNIALDERGCGQFDLKAHAESVRVHLRVPGEFHCYNAAATAAAAGRFGFDLADVVPILEEYDGFEKRTQLFESPQGWIVFNDTYNASPAAVAGALASLVAMQCSGRKIAMLGDMLELGDRSESAHKMIGHKLAGLQPDVLITVGTTSRWIAEAAELEGYKGQMRHFALSDNASEYIVSDIRPGDIVLVKGSRALNMEKIVERLV